MFLQAPSHAHAHACTGTHAREEFREVPGFGGRYLVSSDGRILSLAEGQPKELRHEVTRKGYRRVKLYGGPVPVKVLVHRVVAEAFIPNPLGLNQVNHNDGDKSRNCVSNLEWCDVHRNMRHAVERGLHTKGETHGSAKLKDAEVVAIKSALRISQRSRRALAERYGVSAKTIDSIRMGYTWSHIHA